MGELAGVRGAGGADVKAFCAGPVHALIMAGALVQSGLHRRVVVVAGGSLAKIGMKFLGHLTAGYPILEDVLVGVAIDVVAGRRREPVAPARHRGHARGSATATRPTRWRRRSRRRRSGGCGLRLSDVDRFAVELHNPDITEPAGSGDVPANNYRIIAALAAQAGEIGRDGMAGVRARARPAGLLADAGPHRLGGAVPARTPWPA